MLMLIYILISQINFDTCRYFSDIYIYIYIYVTEISTSIGCIWEVWEKYEKYLICLESNELTMFQVTSFWNICCFIFYFMTLIY